jgi:hypothetical protein
VPLVTTTDYTINGSLPRTESAMVYDQIVSDLTAAKDLLPVDYSAYNDERVRPNKYAAMALLARTYLFRGDYVKAEQEATAVINNTGLYGLINNPDSVFLKNNKEAIWQLLPVIPGYNTHDGFNFILTALPANGALSDNLVNSFEAGDKRKVSWVKSFSNTGATYYFPYKYKIKTGSGLTEYSMILRLAEQFLIRAEARAQQNNVLGSQSDINTIRARAGLALTNAMDKTGLLMAIEHERQTELFTEWGHRWFDLKRTGRADAVLSPIKSPNWQATDIFYPIPQTEINNDPNLTQNAGY